VSGRTGHGRIFMGTHPSTTLANSVCAGIFQEFVFGSMDTVETAAEG
jgi:hypothetical protein